MKGKSIIGWTLLRGSNQERERESYYNEKSLVVNEKGENCIFVVVVQFFDMIWNH